jgi:pyruvate-ferredoxin/flavodoxin oxidoreductase
MGVIAAATGDTASKYVARRETPLYIPENCTQCMECISVCPDTALPNTSQDLSTLLTTAVTYYVTDQTDRRALLGALPTIEKAARTRMVAEFKTGTPLPAILRDVVGGVEGLSQSAQTQFFDIIAKVPMAYQKVNAIFSSPERKAAGSGGVFSIFVSDLCKGCAACVTACGDHQALRMVAETEEVNAEHETGTAFLDLLPDTSQKYLGLFNAANPADSKTATLRNMLMVRTNYDALVSGDGACAGCGEKSVLRSIAAVTEAPSTTPRATALSPRPVSSRRPALPSWPRSRKPTPRATRCCARPSRTSSSAWVASTSKTRSPASPPTRPPTAPSPTRSSSRPWQPCC